MINIRAFKMFLQLRINFKRHRCFHIHKGPHLNSHAGTLKLASGKSNHTFDENSFFSSYLASCSFYKRYTENKGLYNSNEKLRQMLEKVPQFTKEDLVVFMYHSSIVRSLPQDESIRNLPEILSKYINMCSIEELAIISLGLFKTQTKLPENLLHEFARRLCDITPSTDSIVLGSLLKILKFSTSRASIRSLDSVFQSAILHSLYHFANLLDNYSSYTVATLLQFYGRLRVLSDTFCDSLFKYVMNSRVEEWRIKDIQRLVYHFGHFCLSNHIVTDTLLHELKKPERYDELMAFPSNLSSILIGLSYGNIYDRNLIQLVFSSSFMHSLLQKETNDFSRDLYQLYESASIDRTHPDNLTNGHVRARIAEYKRRYLLHNDRDGHQRRRDDFTMDGGDDFNTRITTRDGIVNDTRKLLTSLLNTDHVYISHLLPHYDTQDIELCLDANLCALPKEFWDSNSGHTHIEPFLDRTSVTMETQYRIAVVVHGPTSYFMYYDGRVRQRRLLGLHAMKVRHLTKLGYTVVQISFVELKESRDKIKYMRDKLCESLRDVYK